MKLVIAATGASGTIYLQRLLAQIDCAANEVHLVMSGHAKQVAAQEVDRLVVPSGVREHAENDLNVPFVSGSARFDAMVIAPYSMATLGRIASGCSDTALLRAADVFLKERRKLILVPRETPWSLIHARNVVTLLEAGAVVLPAIPSFYSRPGSVEAVADTVVWRILDQLGLPNPAASSWRKGVIALRQLMDTLVANGNVLFTPDGPRGPVYQVSQGVIFLAQKSGAPIVPIHMEYSSCWRLKSWDRFVVPKPFATLRVIFGEPIRIAPLSEPEPFETKRLRLP